MPVTTTYSLSNPTPITIPAYNNEQSTTSTITTLAGGGFAVVAQDTDGYSDLTFYDATGSVVQTGQSLRVTQTKLTQLSNGNVVLTGIDSQGIAQYEMFSSSGQILEAGVAFGRFGNATQISNVIGDGTDGFVYASVTADGTSNAVSLVFHGAPGQGFEAGIGAVADNNDTSLAQLSDGNYVVAWDTTDTSGHSSVSYEIYSTATGVVKGATVLDNTGTINSQPSVVALPGGGFTIAYQDNSWSGGTGQSDITESVFAADGTLQATSQLDHLGGNDSQPVSIALSNGLVLTGYTNTPSAGTSAVDMVLYDPVSHTVLNDDLYLSVPDSDNPSLSAMANGDFVGSYTYTSSGKSNTFVRVDQVVRTSQADNTGDTIIGDSLSDTIIGGSGNDNLTGGDGADNTLNGGGGYDTANFSGKLADYTILRQGLQTFIARPDGGSDVLTSIEKLHFSDGDLYTPPQVRDLDANGDSDMVLQSTTGAVRVWSISGGAVSANALASMTPSAAYTVVGTGQFTFAADSDADILLQNTNGTMVIWEMDGATVEATASLGSLNSVWKAVTTGDFNGDGNADILLQNSTTGQLDIWLMNGTTATTKATVGGTIGTSWHAIATADFNGDGNSDIVLQNASGQIDIWTMNGVTPSTAALAGTAGSGWIVRSAGDFNGDGDADLLLQNAAGQVAVWFMHGSTVVSKTVVGTVATSFTATGTGDFNGDGQSDIVFQNTSGAVSEWLMNGAAVTTKLNLGNAGTGWHMVAGTGG